MKKENKKNTIIIVVSSIIAIILLSLVGVSLYKVNTLEKYILVNNARIYFRDIINITYE